MAKVMQVTASSDDPKTTTARTRESASAEPSFSDQDSTYRVVWHPEVHHRFNARLYFYLIAVPRTHFDEAQVQIRSAFSALGVRSFTMALVYGPNDVLVRCWLTPGQRIQLKSSFAKERRWQVTELECDEVEYLWAKKYRRRSAEEVAVFYTEIRQLSEEGIYFYRSDDPAMRKLYDAGMLLPAPIRDATSVKFYVWLTGLADPTIAEATSAVRGALVTLENGGHITETTLHRVNDIEFFIKAVAAEFVDVYDAVSQLAQAGKPYGLTSNTMLVAHLPQRETDQIDLSEDISSTLSVLCLLLGPQFKDSVVASTGRVKTTLESLYEEYNDVFSQAPANETVRACLKGIVRYATLGDTDYLNRHAAGFWSKFEYSLRLFLPSVLEDCAPEANWIEEFDMLNVMNRCGVTVPGEVPIPGHPAGAASNPDSLGMHALTLSNVVHILLEVGDNRRAGNALDAHLPERWTELIPDVLALRDAFARGEIFGQAPGDSPLAQRWDVWSEHLLGAAQLLLAVERYLAGRKKHDTEAG